MYHENRNLIHQIIFVLCILFSLISPPYNQGVAWSKEAKTTSGSVATGMVSTVQNNWKIDKKKTVAKCWVECKINTLTGIGIRQEIAISLVENCKALAEDPRHCVITWAFISMSESGWWKNCKSSNKYNCLWLSVNEKYNSYNDGVLHFIWKYNRFWFRQKDPNWFYSNSPNWKPATRFCLSETSSWLPYCKNGHRIAWSVFDKLNKAF